MSSRRSLALGDNGVRSASDPHSIDLDALLVALVLVPHSYSRNRFFALYRFPPARRVRRRAALIRSLIADLVDGADELELEPRKRGMRLRYRLTGVGATRTTLLFEQELALVKLGVERARAAMADAPPLPAALETVDRATSARLAQLLRRLYNE